MIDILFEDGSILVCIKPAGTLSELCDKDNSLPRKICNERALDTLYTIHRLDREVCGVMLFAKTQDAAKKLSADVAERRIKKEYIALVEGELKKDSDTLCDLLFKDSAKNKSYVVQRERKGTKKASLFYETLKKAENATLVKIDLHTGRTHQIRVQFSSRGHSVLGDRKYGSSIKSNEIALCSHKLTFKHPKTKKQMSFSYTPEEIGIWKTK